MQPKASIMPMMSSTNTWSPVSRSWMLHDEEDRFSHALAGKLLASATDKQQVQRHREILRRLRIRGRAGGSEAALLPGGEPGTGVVGCSGTAGDLSRLRQERAAGIRTTDSGDVSLIKTSGLNPARAPAGGESSSRQAPERSDRAGNFTSNWQGMGWICHQKNPHPPVASLGHACELLSSFSKLATWIAFPQIAIWL